MNGLRVLVSGSNGFIGSAVCEKLRQLGHTVVPLVRQVPKEGEISWNSISNEATNKNHEGEQDTQEKVAPGKAAPEKTAPEKTAQQRATLEKLDAVVHLAAEPIAAKRWSAEQKRKLADSRINGTKLLAQKLAELSEPPKVFLSGSAIGIYGDSGDEAVDETTQLSVGHTAQASSAQLPTSQSSPTSFLQGVCREWEAATSAATQVGIRTVLLRTGIVLGPGAPFLARQLPLFKLGLGGRLGSPDRWVSWISLADEVDAIIWLLTQETVSGAVNLTSPEPATNAQLTYALGKALNRPAKLPVPMFLPKLLLGAELVDALTESQRVLPKVLLSNGFNFTHTNIQTAMHAAID